MKYSFWIVYSTINMYKIFEILQSLTHEEFGVPAFRQELSAFLGADLRRQERHPSSTAGGPRLNDHRLPHPSGLDESLVKSSTIVRL